MDIISQQITIILIASVFLILVAFGVISLILVYQKRQLKLVHDQKELQNQFQKELLQTKIETQEETLAHLGRELHDNIGQLLGSSKLLLAAAEANPQPQSALQVLDKTLSDAITQVRALSKSLSADWLDQFDLLANLQAEANRLTLRQFLNVELQHPTTLQLSPEQQLMLFRMAQECIQNAIKHGGAQSIRIEFKLEEPLLRLTIADDGKGFIQTSNQSGVGMMNITTRAKLLGGQAQWQTSPHGTTVSISLPYGQK